MCDEKREMKRESQSHNITNDIEWPKWQEGKEREREREREKDRKKERKIEGQKDRKKDRHIEKETEMILLLIFVTLWCDFVMWFCDSFFYI